MAFKANSPLIVGSLFNGCLQLAEQFNRNRVLLFRSVKRYSRNAICDPFNIRIRLGFDITRTILCVRHGVLSGVDKRRKVRRQSESEER